MHKDPYTHPMSCQSLEAERMVEPTLYLFPTKMHLPILHSSTLTELHKSGFFKKVQNVSRICIESAEILKAMSASGKAAAL